jgi:hypothetical protein
MKKPHLIHFISCSGKPDVYYPSSKVNAALLASSFGLKIETLFSSPILYEENDSYKKYPIEGECIHTSWNGDFDVDWNSAECWAIGGDSESENEDEVENISSHLQMGNEWEENKLIGAAGNLSSINLDVLKTYMIRHEQVYEYLKNGSYKGIRQDSTKAERKAAKRTIRQKVNQNTYSCIVLA